MKIRGFIVVMGLFASLAACGSEVASPGVTVTETLPGTTVATTAIATVSADPVTETVTVKATESTVDLVSEAVCAEARNSLAASGIVDPLDRALAGEEALTLEFSGPVKDWQPVSPGGSDPITADAVIALNEAFADLKQEIFTKWTQEQTTALGDAYTSVKVICGF